MTEPRRHDAIAVAILALLPMLLFIDVLVGTNALYLRDLAHYNFPLKHVLRDVAVNGEFPYWNRWFSAGQPLAANPQHQVFYPLTWLILLPDSFLGFRLLILIHLSIGLVSMYALLRSMELRIPSAFAGALAFGLGGICMSYVNLLPFLFCAVWLPLTCLFARRCLLRPSIRDFALASVFFGLQVLVGEPTTLMQSAAVLFAYALYRAWHSERSGVRRLLVPISLAVAIVAGAMLVGAVQLMPAVDHARDSVRSQKFDFRLVGDWSMPPLRLFEIAYPNFFGYPFLDGEPRYWGREKYDTHLGPYLYSIYSGFLAVTLTIAGLTLRRRGWGLAVGLIGGSALMAMGAHTPLLRALYDAGIGQTLRYPEKYILTAGFVLVVFSSTLLDRLLSGDDALRRRLIVVGSVLTAAAALAVLASTTGSYAEAFAAAFHLPPRLVPSRVDFSRAAWIAATVRGLVLLAMVAALSRMRRPLWLVLAGTLVLADLWTVESRLNPRVPAAFFTEPPAAAARVARVVDGRFRLFHQAQWGPRSGMEEILRSGDASYWMLRNGLFAATPATWGIASVMDQDVDKTSLLPTAWFTAALQDAARSGREDYWKPFAAMSNVRVRASFSDVRTARQRAGGNLALVEPFVFEHAGDFPRYYFADRIVTIGNRREFGERLAKGGWSDAVAFVPIPEFLPAPGVVRSWSETANTATIDVESSGRGFLVMSVTPHKYWSVTLDGGAVQPILTNLGYQGIVVPAGRHRVGMRYSNPLILKGALISGASLAALLLAITRRRTAPATG